MNPESNASMGHEGGTSGKHAPEQEAAIPSVDLHCGGVRWRVLSGDWVDKLEPILVSPDRLSESNPDPIYTKPGVELVRIPSTISGSSRWVLRKNTYVRPLARLRDSLRSSAAIRTFRNSLALRRSGIPTPRVLAAGIRRRFWLPVTGYLLMEEVFPVSTLVQCLRDEGSLPGEVVRRVAEVIAQMHENGILHGDLTINNILLDGEHKPWFVDLDRARFVGKPLKISKAAEDFYRLVRHVDSLGCGARVSAFRLLKQYCVGRNWQGMERKLVDITLKRLHQKLS